MAETNQTSGARPLGNARIAKFFLNDVTLGNLVAVAGQTYDTSLGIDTHKYLIPNPIGTPIGPNEISNARDPSTLYSEVGNVADMKPPQRVQGPYEITKVIDATLLDTGYTG
ncbi:MAG: hypothetical protein ABIC04_06845 [Nanoarchaeota archaeon]